MSDLYPHEILIKYLKEPSSINFILIQAISFILVLAFIMILIAYVDPNSVSPQVIPLINLGLNVAADLAVLNTVIGVISLGQFLSR